MRQLFFLVLFLGGSFVHASDSIRIELNTKKFTKGDTLEFTCTIPDFSAQKLANATLNVWIDDLEKHTRWKFRYPMINGEVAASLLISDKIPDGRYAINFLVQRGFFKIMGEVINHEKGDTAITYMMIQKKSQGSYFDNAHVASDGSFRLKSTLFADSAIFVFSPAKKTKTNYLAIKIETPLDSAFTPVLAETHFITVGNAEMLVSKKTDTTRYVFDAGDLIDSTGMLPGVVVSAKIKTKVQQYNDAYSSGMFQSDKAIIFDGIESDEITNSISVLMFLQRKVPGLIIEKTDNGLEFLKWRNEVAEIYVDEFRLDSTDHTLVIPSQIAMIKVYRPPAGLSGMTGAVGAIAIYTKKGAFADKNNTRHNFIVKGYTKMESRWE